MCSRGKRIKNNGNDANIGGGEKVEKQEQVENGDENKDEVAGKDEEEEEENEVKEKEKKGKKMEKKADKGERKEQEREKAKKEKGQEKMGDSLKIKNEKLPLAELILASHASLLLHTVYSAMSCCTYGTDEVVMKYENGSISGSSNSSSMGGVNEPREEGETLRKGKVEVKVEVKEVAVQRVGDKDKNENEDKEMNCGDFDVSIKSSAAVRSSLPHESWWLPIRVLKGFLVLQGQVLGLDMIR